MLTTRELLAARELVPELAEIPCVAIDDLDLTDAAGHESRIAPEDLAILQYSSGSSGVPRGVMVSHANLMANELMIEEAFGHTPSTVALGWLPFQHDMGLIGYVLQPVYTGFECVIMTPLQFLKHPLRWLQEITRYRANTSGGPNFAYEMCVAAVERHGEKSLEGLDLSSWNLAFAGAEPVRAATLDRFEKTFAGVGFRREAFYPCYGLAEATLIVSGGQHGESPAVWRDPSGLNRVSCGHARTGLEVAIVDMVSETRCDDGVEGEIWVSGTSVAPATSAASRHPGTPSLPRSTARHGYAPAISAALPTVICTSPAAPKTPWSKTVSTMPPRTSSTPSNSSAWRR